MSLNEDCVFIFEDQKLTANKFNLACNSPVFDLMFYGPLAASEIQITDIKWEDFKQMLDYIPTGDITVNSIANAWSLFYISQKYFLNYLKKVCLDYINCNLSISTLVISYEYAQLYNLKELARKCLLEILLSAKEILTVDYHMQATTFCALLDENCINADEEDLIEAAIKWAETECTITDAPNKYEALTKSQIFQRLRFTSLGPASIHYLNRLLPETYLNNMLPLINQNLEKRRNKICNIRFSLRYRFRETYKIEQNICLRSSESEFNCGVRSSCGVVVYGVAIAQPHQGGLVTAISKAEVSVFDASSNLVGKAVHDIVTQGDYEVPDLVNFEQGIRFESNVLYRICVKYSSSCKKPNELLCFYLSRCIKGNGNSVKLQFEDDFCGGVVRGISYYML